MGPATGRLAVIFDGDCGFCTRVVRRLKMLDRAGRLQIQPFQKPGLPAAYGLTRKQCERKAWAVTPDGRRHSGAGAVFAAIAWTLGRPGLLRLYYWPVVRQVGDAVYAAVAASRPLLPGDEPYCRQHPEECEANGCRRVGPT